MKNHYCAETNRIITVHDCGTITYEQLKTKPSVDGRNVIEVEVDGLFRDIGYAAAPLLTTAVMAFGFAVVMLIAVIGKWLITGTPF